MEKAKDFGNTKFSSRIIRKAIEACRIFGKDEKETVITCDVKSNGERWSFDSLDEFLASYANDTIESATLNLIWNRAAGIRLTLFMGSTSVVVTGSSRSSIESVFSVFEEAPTEDKTTVTTTGSDLEVKIFIGHGRSRQWEKLKIHLQDKHELDVVAYETGARAGHTIRDILDRMSEESSLALLVLTGEDKTTNGVRARQNVVHECGLFQGRLGFDRAILIVEHGVELASNFDGLQQLRFKKGRISEVFGDVVATIRREFGPI